MSWLDVAPFEPAPHCAAQRGGSRSTVRCEMPSGHCEMDGWPRNYHAGRGTRGQWFFWLGGIGELPTL
jgi:hypothetical protein